MHLSTEYTSTLLLFGRCDQVHPGVIYGTYPLPVPLLHSRQTIGVLHAQGTEDIPFGKVSQVLSGNDFDDMLQDDIVEATILKTRSRLEVTFVSGNVLHEPFRIGWTMLFL